MFNNNSNQFKTNHGFNGFNRLILWYLLVVFHASRAATHWVVTEDGKIHTQVRHPSLKTREKGLKTSQKLCHNSGIRLCDKHLN